MTKQDLISLPVNEKIKLTDQINNYKYSIEKVFKKEGDLKGNFIYSLKCRYESLMIFQDINNNFSFVMSMGGLSYYGTDLDQIIADLKLKD